jgi:hypothetical protein
MQHACLFHQPEEKRSHNLPSHTGNHTASTNNRSHHTLHPNHSTNHNEHSDHTTPPHEHPNIEPTQHTTKPHHSTPLHSPLPHPTTHSLSHPHTITLHNPLICPSPRLGHPPSSLMMTSLHPKTLFNSPSSSTHTLPPSPPLPTKETDPPPANQR